MKRIHKAKVNCLLLNFSKKHFFNYPCPRKLREIMQMSLIEREDTNKINKIWTEYHRQKFNTFGTVIDGETMNQVFKK